MAEKKTNDYYSLIISNKAQLPSNANNLKHDFGLSEKDLKIPHLKVQDLTSNPFNIKF